MIKVIVVIIIKNFAPPRVINDVSDISVPVTRLGCFFLSESLGNKYSSVGRKKEKLR